MEKRVQKLTNGGTRYRLLIDGGVHWNKIVGAEAPAAEHAKASAELDAVAESLGMTSTPKPVIAKVPTKEASAKPKPRWMKRWGSKRSGKQ